MTALIRVPTPSTSGKGVSETTRASGQRFGGLTGLLRRTRNETDAIDVGDDEFLEFLRGALLDDAPLGPLDDEPLGPSFDTPAT